MSNKRLWIAVVLIPLGLMVLVLGSSIMEYRDSLERFPKRHVEATAAIERIYGHFVRFGKWPNQDELDAIRRETLQSDWDCSEDSSLEAPIICLYGPYHFGLYYYFDIPHKRMVSHSWTFSNEGNQRIFQTAIQYAVDEGQ